MGVEHDRLPAWDDIQLVTAQISRRPLLDDDGVGTGVRIGATAAKPLDLAIPLFVSDMSFGALSREAKIALAKGAEAAGTGICSGEGGMLPDEQAENSRYFYELASGKFGWSLDKVRDVQAFHFKFGQGAKTGTGGHLPGNKVVGEIAEVRNLDEGTAAVSPATFPDLTSIDGLPCRRGRGARRVGRHPDRRQTLGPAHRGRHRRGPRDRGRLHHPRRSRRRHRRRPGHLPRPHLGPDDPCARPGPYATSTAPTPTSRSSSPVGLRTHVDFVKALALGADAIAVSNSAMQAIGCIGDARLQHRQLPGGHRHPATRAATATRRSTTRRAAWTRFFEASVELMQVLARACGHSHLNQFSIDDLTTFDREMHHLAGVPYGGITPMTTDDPTEPTDATHPPDPGGSWQKILDPDELDEGRVTTVTVGRRSFAVTRHDGRYGCLDNACPHQGGPLGEGSIERWLAAVPVARLRLLAPRPVGRPRASTTHPPASTPRCATTASTSAAPGRSAPASAPSSDVLVETMVNWGLTHVFGMVGHSNLGFADAMRLAEQRGDLTFVGIRHEGAAAFAASAYGKFTGEGRRLFRHRRAGIDEPADRPLRRQGRSLAGAGASPARCRRA